MTCPPLCEQVERIRDALHRPLPGLAVHREMAPRPRPGLERILDPDLDCLHAAVLVLLYPERVGQAQLALVLTRRTELVNSHRGQISLPGGRVEAGESHIQAAIREAQEELGLDPARCEILGHLSPVYIPRTNFCVYPVVAFMSEPPAFQPSPVEVAEVIEVPVRDLLDSSHRRQETWELHGEPVLVPYFAFGGHKVWGATAMILAELAAVIDLARQRGGSGPNEPGETPVASSG